MTTKCPYCTSEIGDEALVCPHCTRDLYLLKLLQVKVAELERKLAELEALQPATAVPESPAVELPTEPEAEPVPSAGGRLLEIAVLWGVPLVLLLAAHGLITIVYDLNTLWLRIVSLLIPLPFGLALTNRRWRNFALWGLAAFAMAACAVLGMSWLTSLVDHTPVWPQDRREWKEFVEYAASVGFSFITGMVLGRMLWHRRQQALQMAEMRGLAVKIARTVMKGHENVEKLQATVKKLNDMGGSLTAAATSAAAAYTGLQGFLGGG